MGVLFVFVDGLGIGSDDPAANPVADPRLGFLRPVAGGRPAAPGRVRRVSLRGRSVCVTAADACLGVPGLPQSATGQATLLTGLNTPAYLGRHMRAYPTGRLKRLLEKESLFACGVRGGRRVTFLNMFRPDGLRLLLAGERPASATTAAALGARLALRTREDLLRGTAVYHDVTCWTIHEAYDVPLVEPEDAARRALDVARSHDFCLFEYFLTDIAGHSRDPELGRCVLLILDRFLLALLEGCGGRAPSPGPESGEVVPPRPPAPLTVVLASDHGNIEDPSVRTHTRNPVPVVAFGARAEDAIRGILDISHVAGRLARLAGIGGGGGGDHGPADA